MAISPNFKLFQIDGTLTYGQLNGSNNPPPFDDPHWERRTISANDAAEAIRLMLQSSTFPVVSIIGARIEGEVDLSEVNSTSRLEFVECQFGSNSLILSGSTLRSLNMSGTECHFIDLSGTRIAEDLAMTNGFTARGVYAPKIRVGGDIDMSGATIRGLVLLERAMVEGDVKFATAKVFTTEKLVQEWTVRINGEIRMARSMITGDVKFQGARISYEQSSWSLPVDTSPSRTMFAIDCTEIHVGGSFEMDDCKVNGVSSFRNTKIVRHFMISSSTFSKVSPDFSSSSWHGTIDADGIAVMGSMRISGGEISGLLSLIYADIHEDLHLSGKFSPNPCRSLKDELEIDPMAISVDLQNSRAHSLLLCRGFRADGVVSLQCAMVVTFVDDKESWPKRICLDGFQYSSILEDHDLDAIEGQKRRQSFNHYLGWEQRSKWLLRQSDYSATAYSTLASSFRVSGRAYDARKILIARDDHLSKPPNWWSDRLSRRKRLLRRFFRISTGFGYEPWRIVGIALPFVILMSLWYTDALNHSVLRRTQKIEESAPQATLPAPTIAVASQIGVGTCTDRYVCAQPIILAIDTIIPIVDLGQKEHFAPDQSHKASHWWLFFRDGRVLAWATWVVTLFGWAAAALLAGSLAQAHRRVE